MTISFNKLSNNDGITNLVIFVTIALSVGYIMNKNYNALIMLYLLGMIFYLLCENVLCSLGISIILTNILIALNMVNVRENMENKNKKKKTKSIIDRKMIQNE
jgi:hypothetical protein|tara:strand:- start:13339 stop:13647 length:309 start_codon:yes stop_codon:yes gene_type:complete